jgi:hypothetical protein
MHLQAAVDFMGQENIISASTNFLMTATLADLGREAPLPRTDCVGGECDSFQLYVHLLLDRDATRGRLLSFLGFDITGNHGLPLPVLRNAESEN